MSKLMNWKLENYINPSYKPDADSCLLNLLK